MKRQNNFNNIDKDSAIIAKNSTINKLVKPTISVWSLKRADYKDFLIKNHYSIHHLNNLVKYVYQNFHHHKINTANFAKNILKDFHENFCFNLIKINKSIISSADNSVKFIVDLEDNNQIEMVLLCEKNRLTLCVSSQVGCKRKCNFCATGRMNLKRNLTTKEIINQIILCNIWLKNPDSAWHYKNINHQKNNQSLRLKNIVFMGMGEPLDNLVHLQSALSIIIDRDMLNFSTKKVTVSTAGQLNALKKMYQNFANINYAISIHSALDKQRSSLMPINKSYPLKNLIAFLREKSIKDNKVFFIQYTLINGVNDSIEDAYKLVELLSDVKVKINLLRFNPIENSLYKTPKDETINNFKQILYNNSLFTTFRHSKSKDIAGACGQLITKKAH